MVGSAHSGTAIASAIAETADQVIHMVRRPRWIIERNIPTGTFNNGPVLPQDLIKTRDRQSKLTMTQFYEYYKGLCAKQNNIPALEMKDTDKFGLVIDDTYLQKVEDGKILPVKDEILQFENSTVVFKSGSRQNIDSVIFCTGYQTDLNYFDKELMDKFQLGTPHSSLFKYTLHPDFPTLAFIALTYRDLGAVFPVAELQGALACQHFLGQLQLSPPDNIPIGNNLQLLDTLAASVNKLPDFNSIKHEDSELYKLMWYGAAIPAHYQLTSEKNAQQAREIIEYTEKYRQTLLTVSSDHINLKNDYATTGLFGNSGKVQAVSNACSQDYNLLFIPK